MNPIISPMFIYVLGIINNVRFLIILSAVVSFVISIAYASWVIDNGKPIPKLSKILFVVSMVGFTVFSFTPNKETLIAMYTTKYITVENVKLGKEVVVDTVKEIIEVINKKN